MKKFKIWSVNLEDVKLVMSVAVLSLLFVIGLFTLLNRFEIPIIVKVILVILMLVLLSALCLIAYIVLRRLFDRKFVKESGDIIRRFNDTKDAVALYYAFLNIKNPPKTLKYKTDRYIDLSYALDLQGRTEEALQLLDEIYPQSKAYKGAVENQKTAILAKAQGITADEVRSSFVDLEKYEVGSLSYATVFGSVPIMISLITIAFILKLSDSNYINSLPDDVLLIGIITVATVLRIFIGPILNVLLRGSFRKESWEITSRFHETKDAAQYYNALVNMKHLPRFLDDVNTRYISLSTALLLQERPEEALQTLDKMRTKNKELREFYEKRREYILSQIQDSAGDTTD